MKTSFALATLLSLALASPLHTRQNNLQPFTGALGGIAATPIVDSGVANRPFQVKSDSFVNISAALARSCDQQFNACANKANGGDKTLSVGDCSAQKDQCDAASQGAAAGAGASGNANANADNGNQNQNQNGNQNQNQNANGGNAAVCTRKAKRGSKKA